jgi:predicted RNA-binding protein with PIN domain
MGLVIASTADEAVEAAAVDEARNSQQRVRRAGGDRPEQMKVTIQAMGSFRLPV